MSSVAAHLPRRQAIEASAHLGCPGSPAQQGARWSREAVGQVGRDEREKRREGRDGGKGIGGVIRAEGPYTHMQDTVQNDRVCSQLDSRSMPGC